MTTFANAVLLVLAYLWIGVLIYCYTRWLIPSDWWTEKRKREHRWYALVWPTNLLVVILMTFLVSLTVFFDIPEPADGEGGKEGN